MIDCFLGIDIGTTGVKAIVLDQNGKTISSAIQELEVITPNIGWAEQRAEDWWDATLIAVKKALGVSQNLNKSVRAIGLSGQMLGLVVLDKELKILVNPIIWLDQRAEKEVTFIKNKINFEDLLQNTANIPITGYLAPKILWIKKNMPDIYKKIYKIIFPKDYIRFLLTKELATEVSDLGGSYLYDIKKRCFSDKMFDLLDIPKDIFPKNIYESEDVAGYLSEEKASEFGLEPGIPVVAGGGDQPVGAVGCGVVEEGKVLVSIGTSGVIFTTTEKVYLDYKSRAIIAGCHSARGKWSLLGCTLSAGGSLKWLKDNFAITEKDKGKISNKSPFIFLDLTAEKAPIGSYGLFFLPYLNGERSPYPDPFAKGVFFGFSLRHGWPEMVRSVIEGVTFSLRDIIEIFKELKLSINQIIVTGGGSKSPFWRQMLADIFNCNIVTVNNDEGPAAGAAILAMVGAGYFKNTAEACNTIIKPAEVTKPVDSNVEKYERLYSFYRSLYPPMKSLFKSHSEVLGIYR